MSWYMAVMVRGSFVDGALDEDRLGDTVFKLIEAPAAESAYQRALEMGAAPQDDYTDDDGQTVQLQFLGLADLREIEATFERALDAPNGSRERFPAWVSNSAVGPS